MRVHLPMSPRAVLAEVVAALEQAELEAGTIAPCPFDPNGRRRRTKAPCPSLAVRPEGANHLWRKNPPRELSIDLVADERLGRVTGRAGAS
jgi:hypothetical protein